MKRILLLNVLMCLQLSVAKAQLNTPNLILPANNAIFISPNETLDWAAVTGATSYEYKLGTIANLTGVQVQSITASQASTANLLFGSTYYWQVRALKTTVPIDSSAWSPIWNFTTLDTLYLVSPANHALNVTPDVLLDWSPISGISNYDFEWDTTPAFNSALKFYSSTTASQAYTFNLQFGTKYYWHVRAHHAADTTQWSEIRSFTTLDTLYLVSPANHALNVTPDVLLDWSPISGISNYDFEWDTTPAFNSALKFYSSTTASQAYTFNLQFGTKYYWHVRAHHAADTTKWSEIRNFTTLDTLYLVSPANHALNVTPDVLLDWSPISGISNYDFEWDTTPAFNSALKFYSSTTASQAYTFNLQFGTKYYWHVRAHHAADTTQWSEVRNFTTLDTLYLVSPANHALNVTPDVLLDWSPISGISNYDFEWDTTPAFNSALKFYSSTTASQAYTFNLQFGTKYYWHVRAHHAADTTQWSEVRNFTTLDTLYLVSPANHALNVTPDVLLDWSPISGISNYDFEWDTTPAFNSALKFYSSITASQAYTFNLQFGTKYYWHVRAHHAADTTQWSEVRSFTTIDSLYHVSPVNGALNISLNPTIDWAPLSGITGYQYQYSTNPYFSNAMMFTLGATSQANLVNLSYGTTYYWQVRACHTADTSAWSAPWNFTTIYQITSAPSLVSPFDNAINLPVATTSIQWTSVPNATFYEYQFDTNNLFVTAQTATSSQLNEMLPLLQSSATYYWHVRAGNGSGYSPWSVVWSFTTGSTANINELDENVLMVWPNPVSSKVHLKLPLGFTIADVALTDVLGNTITVNSVESNYINVESLPAGLYFIGIRNQPHFTKLVKY